jgi:hypothetical protein
MIQDLTLYFLSRWCKYLLWFKKLFRRTNELGGVRPAPLMGTLLSFLIYIRYRGHGLCVTFERKV